MRMMASTTLSPSSPSSPDGVVVVTTDFLTKEISDAEKALHEKEDKLQQRQRQLQNNSSNSNDETEKQPPAVTSVTTTTSRLVGLHRSVDQLLLAQEIAEWANHNKQCDDDDGDLVQEAKSCQALAELLCRHHHHHHKPNSTTSSDPDASSNQDEQQLLYETLYQKEYLPLYQYLVQELIVSLQRSLHHAKYPSKEGCSELIRQAKKERGGHKSSRIDSVGDYQSISQCVQWLIRLKTAHQEVVHHVQGTGASSAAVVDDVVVVELLRPFVERVKFLFVDKSTADSDSDRRLTSSRIDRLPEWLLGYLKENILQKEGGPWELVHDCLAVTATIGAGDDDDSSSSGISRASMSHHLPEAFLNELVRLVQWVLGERNFFRHPKVAGRDSNPMLLCNAIEQLLQFDHYIQGLVVNGRHCRYRVLKLMDIYVAGDDELLQWWLERERETVFSTLFDDDETATPKVLVNRVAPRAELFCALIRSIMIKASVFSFSGPYLNHVAAPLCMQFVDAVHESATDLRNLLSQRRKMPSDTDLESNVMEWIELINGTHLAALILSSSSNNDIDQDNDAEQQQASWLSSTSSISSGDQDLARFGRSLQSLEQVLLDEFATTFVESLLMERAKFAGYLMRCSNLLGSDVDDGFIDNMSSSSLSPDLRETERLLRKFLHVCDDTSALAMDDDEENERAEAKEIAQYAPRLMRDRVLALLADKLMEVALDLHGMTPDLLPCGSAVFARDVQSLFGVSLVPPHVLRLMDIANMMSMERVQLAQMGDALCGLAGQPAPLTEESFTADERLFDEALSMIRAKGFAWIELTDVLAVLNRRRDLIMS